jgi:hypothetical protein
MGLSLSLERGHEGHVREVLQEDCSNTYSNYTVLSSCNIIYSRNMSQFPHTGNLIRNIDWCLFFRRLKINHDSHEFILESGTVANSHSLRILISAHFHSCPNMFRIKLSLSSNYLLAFK